MHASIWWHRLSTKSFCSLIAWLTASRHISTKRLLVPRNNSRLMNKCLEYNILYFISSYISQHLKWNWEYVLNVSFWTVLAMNTLKYWLHITSSALHERRMCLIVNELIDWLIDWLIDGITAHQHKKTISAKDISSPVSSVHLLDMLLAKPLKCVLTQPLTHFFRHSLVHWCEARSKDLRLVMD